MKKAFSLFELILVVVIIGISYTFININFSKLSKKDEATVNLKNIKEYLSTIEYNDTLSLKCIDEAKRCLIFVDGELLEENSFDIFKSIPTVYSYDEAMNVKDFEYIDMDGYRNFKVDFELNLDKELRHEDLIVEVDEKVYYFNPLFLKATEFTYLNEVIGAITKKIDEVKYAF